MTRNRNRLLFSLLFVCVAYVCPAHHLLGWSQDGRIIAVAFFQLGFEADSADLQLVIQDLVTDEIVYQHSYDWSNPGAAGIDLEHDEGSITYEHIPMTIDEALSIVMTGDDRWTDGLTEHGIVAGGSDLQHFPLRTGGDEFRVLFRGNDVVQEGEPYPVIVESRNRGRKSITDLSTSENYALPSRRSFFGVLGCFVNPAGTRMAVCLSWDCYECSPTLYGCALNIGYDPDAYQDEDIGPLHWGH
jgi:hypothetical protein